VPAAPLRRPRHPPRLAFSTLACPDWSLLQVVTAAATLGYQGVELRLLAGEVDLLVCPEFSPARQAETRQLLREHNVEICGLASSVRFDHDSATERARQLDIGRRYLDLAAELGAGFVRIFGDTLPALDQLPERDRAVTAIAGLMRVLADYAHRQTPGVRLVVETHGDFVGSEWMARLVRRVGNPHLGVLWDTHHPWRFAGEPLGETARRLGSTIGHTHWKDSTSAVAPASSAASREATQRARELMSGHREAAYCLLGEGEFPAVECLRELARCEYTGWYSLEWEKAWHPELADPEIALPQFPVKFRELWEIAFAPPAPSTTAPATPPPGV